MELYKDAHFNDESIPLTKKEEVALRKIQGDIDIKRKEVKKKCLEPYVEFEEKANELNITRLFVQ